jgi:hypothetical protein
MNKRNNFLMGPRKPSFRFGLIAIALTGKRYELKTVRAAQPYVVDPR